jgi:hypothetical protein
MARIIESIFVSAPPGRASRRWHESLLQLPKPFRRATQPQARPALLAPAFPPAAFAFARHVLVLPIANSLCYQAHRAVKMI